MGSSARVLARTGSVIGLVKPLRLEGEWNPDVAQLFRDRRCDALDWLVPRGGRQGFGPLVDVAADLRFLRIRSDTRMDDSALQQLTSLEYLDALTKGQNALDLSLCSKLVFVAVDDRLEGLKLPQSLQYVTLYNAARPLRFFEPLQRMEVLRLESGRDYPHSVASSLSGLRSLRLRGGTFESFGGLDAPLLETLTVEGVEAPDSVDVSPLVRLRGLQLLSFAPRNQVAVRNVRALETTTGVGVSLGGGARPVD